jgi:hypothetical protein
MPLGSRADIGPAPARIAASVAAALAFLETTQLPTGEIPVFTTTATAPETRIPDGSVFPTALAAHSLSFAGEAAGAILDNACRFLRDEMDANGLWRHWTRDHPFHAQLPPDLDDTSCAAAALAGAGRLDVDNRALLLANRDRRGLFRTWFIPRLAWTGAASMRAMLPQLRHASALLLFFRRTSARPGDVDAVVNANALHYLGPFPGHERVVAYLTAILREGAESACDKWYDNPIVVRYFLSRALARVAPDARQIVLDRAASALWTNPLEAALLASTFADWDCRVPAEIARALLESQLASGGWPPAAVYHGGRKRLAGGRFAAPHPDTPSWGSEALTAAFAVEALCRYGRAR